MIPIISSPTSIAMFTMLTFNYRDVNCFHIVCKRNKMNVVLLSGHSQIKLLFSLKMQRGDYLAKYKFDRLADLNNNTLDCVDCIMTCVCVIQLLMGIT